MSKITNDSLTRSDTGYPCGNSGRQRVNKKKQLNVVMNRDDDIVPGVIQEDKGESGQWTW